MLDDHQERFKENMDVYSKEQGERFQQDVKQIEWRYEGHYNEKMMGDYIFSYFFLFFIYFIKKLQYGTS